MVAAVGWCVKEVKDSYGVSLWKSIHRGWPSFSNHLFYLVRDGSWVKFWHDKWCGDTPLKEAYPELFFIALDRNVSVADLMSHINVCFTGMCFSLRVFRIGSWSPSRLDLLYSNPVQGRGEDKISWGSLDSNCLELLSLLEFPIS